MGIVNRYVILETLKTIAIALATMTLLLSFAMAAKEAVRLGLPTHVVLRAMPCFVVEMLGFALPACVLFAVCSVFGRMSQENELVALKSLGISPWRVIEPVLAIACAISLVAVLSYEVTATWGRPGVRMLLADAAAEIATGILRTQKTLELPGDDRIRIMVREVRGEKLVEPVIRVHEPKTGAQTFLTASEGRLERHENGIQMVLMNLNLERTAGGAGSHSGELVIPLPGSKQDLPIHRDFLATCDIRRHLSDFKIRSVEQQKAIEQAENDVQRKEMTKELAWIMRKIARLEAEPHRRWANGFSCLAFALVGIPLAVMVRSAQALVAFFAAFMPILILFYPLLMVSQSLAISGVYPACSFWLADAVLSTLGGLALRRVVTR